MSNFEPIPDVIEVTVALDDEQEKTFKLDLKPYFTKKERNNPTQSTYHELEDVIRDEIMTQVKWWWS